MDYLKRFVEWIQTVQITNYTINFKFTWVTKRLKRENTAPGSSEWLPLLGDDGPDGDVVVRDHAAVITGHHPVRVQIKFSKIQLILVPFPRNLK